MVEERITTVEPQTGQGASTVHHTTVVTDERSRGGSPGWFVGIVILLALVVGIYFLTGLSKSETAKDNAVAGAAAEVGKAANKAGAAVEQAGQAVENEVNK